VLTLYSNLGSGNCYKVRLLLTQLNIPFQVEEIDVLKGEQRTPDFRTRNPNAKVPVVRLESGEFLSESGAILYHFARGTPLWPTDPLQQTRVLQWMFFEQYSHEPYIAVVRYWCVYLENEEEQGDLLTEKREKGYQALAVMEEHLDGREFFVDDRYTIADIALYAYTHVAEEGGFKLEGFPNIRAWIDRVASQSGHLQITHRC
jgi:glutathione S-transferase